MNKKTYLLIVGLAAVVSLVSGVLTQLFTPTPVLAQWRDIVKADLFKLDDFKGVKRARLGLSGGNQEYTYFWFADQHGRVRMYITVYPDNRTPKIEFYDANKNVVATLPDGLKANRIRRDHRLTAIPAPKRARKSRGSSGSRGGKADYAQPADINYLQSQVDQLWSTVNQTVKTVNRLIK